MPPQKGKPESLVDCHSHLDLFSDPLVIAKRADDAGVYTVSVTNTPSAFLAGQRFFHGFKRVRLAMGLHPKLSHNMQNEFKIFRDNVHLTSYIGEIGLDFSNPLFPPKNIQLSAFGIALDAIESTAKFISIHSRSAVEEVLSKLQKHKINRAVFHWFSGTIEQLAECAEEGHYFSVNHQMLNSKKGRALAERIPRNRLLTETDGPFTLINGHKATPWEVSKTLKILSELYGTNIDNVAQVVTRNFLGLISLIAPSK